MTSTEETKETPDDMPEDDGYKVSEKVAVEDLMNKDKDDKALNKYKQNLLGDPKDKIIDDKDPRQVFFDKLLILPEGRDPVELNPNKCNSNEVAFTLKEKSKYTVQLQFRVQRDIVLGLKKFDLIYRKGIRVDKTTEMIGSFKPSNKDKYTHNFPEQTTPDGMLARGTYVAKTQFVDDDKNVHLKFEYKFKIAKTWE